MCGSGTFVIEAACRAMGHVPGMNREFACDAWSGPGRQDVGTHVPTMIVGGDRDGAIIESAERNAHRAGVSIDLKTGDARELEAPTDRGLLICNPPYGQRVEGKGGYDTLGHLLSGSFKRWPAGVICSGKTSLKSLGRKPASSLRINNGGIKLDFHVLPPTE